MSSNLNLEQVWKNTQEELKIILAPAVFQTFVSPSQLVSLKDNIATIACPSNYLVDMNTKRYYHLFKSALDNQTKQKIKLKFVNQQPVRKQSLSKPTPLFDTSQSSRFTQSSNTVNFNPHQLSLQRANLHPKYTFDNLIVGNSNNFAFAAAQGIIKNPGLSYNPFFVWGGVGVGKTHLMQAIGHQLLKNKPDLKIRYFPAETFGNELIQSLKTRNMTKFKSTYRNLDCILVDDVQFIAGKEYIQEEFFHTFNSLHLSGKQIILTSDRKPSEIDHLEDRLVSRFMGGLTVDIQLPGYEMRVAIIKQKAIEIKINLTPQAIDHLAKNIQSNIRDIEGKLREISILSQTNQTDQIDTDFLSQFFSLSQTNQNSQRDISPRHLVSTCAKFYKIKTGDLCGKSRKKDLVHARHTTAYLLINLLNLPLEKVGDILGGRDHTSIMHARDKIHTLFSTNPQFQKELNLLKSQL